MDKTQFINKKNIGYVNYLVNNTLGLTDLTKDDKKFIINTLVKNMDYVYGKLNHSKITKKNYKGAIEQFNQLTYKRTIRDLQKNIQESEQEEEKVINSQNIQQVKMKRDQINNSQSLNYMDHPTMMGNNPIPNMEEIRMSRDMVTNNDAQVKYLQHPEMSLNTRSNEFDNNFEDNYTVNNHERLLKTRDGPQYVDRQMAVNSRHGLDNSSSNMSANDRFNELQQSRETEIRQRQARPPTPEFIKNNREKERQTSQPYQQEQNFQQQNQNTNNFGLEGVGNDDGLGSLDDYGQSLAPKNLEIDESISVEERLKQMEAERGSMSMPTAMNDKSYNRNVSMSNRVTTNTDTTQYQSEIQSQKEKWEQEQQNFSNQPQIMTTKRTSFNNIQKPQSSRQIVINTNTNTNTKSIDNSVSEYFESQISQIKDDLYNTLNPIIQNTNSLQTEIGTLKSMQSNSVDYTKQFDLLNKNFQLLSNRTSQNKDSQSKNLKQLSDSLNNFYTDINTRLNLLSNHNKIKQKKFLLDEDNYNRNNKEFFLDLKPDLQKGKISIINLDVTNTFNEIDSHNNRFYFKLQQSESSTTSENSIDTDEIEINSITIDSSDYNSKKLLEYLNKKLEKFDIIFKKNKSGYVSINLKENSEYIGFSIYNLDNSILPTLGFSLKKYENAINYTSEDKINLSSLSKPNIYNIFLVDNENTLIRIGKYSVNSSTVFMDDYSYENLQNIRLKFKLQNDYPLSIDNISNIELSITFTDTSESVQTNTMSNNDSTYSFTN
jgi:hypothetical protein